MLTESKGSVKVIASLRITSYPWERTIQFYLYVVENVVGIIIGLYPTPSTLPHASSLIPFPWPFSQHANVSCCWFCSLAVYWLQSWGCMWDQSIDITCQVPVWLSRWPPLWQGWGIHVRVARPADQPPSWHGLKFYHPCYDRSFSSLSNHSLVIPFLDLWWY